MATLYRVRRTNVDVSPNQLVAAPASGQVIALVGFHISNTANPTDSYIGFFNDTSGNVTVGTTSTAYGRLLIPANGQVYDRSGSERNPLMTFANGLTCFAATTETGTTSPTSDLTDTGGFYRRVCVGYKLLR